MAASRRLFHLPRLEVQSLILMYVKIFVSSEIKSKARLLLSLLCVLLEGWEFGWNSQKWSSGKENALLKMLSL